MQQAKDFLEESEILLAQMEGVSEAEFEHPTGFKRWTVDDILVHLHFWNVGADMSPPFPLRGAPPPGPF